MDTKTMFGVSASEIKDNEVYGYNTLASPNPTNSWWWHIFVYTPYQTTVTNCFQSMRIDLTYYVRFHRSNVLIVDN